MGQVRSVIRTNTHEYTELESGWFQLFISDRSLYGATIIMGQDAKAPLCLTSTFLFHVNHFKSNNKLKILVFHEKSPRLEEKR